MKIQRVLFVCTFSGARSLIAEKFTNQLAHGKIEAYSSSFESGKIGPLPIAVMKEIGIDMPTDAPKSVWDRYVEKESFNWVVTLCHEISGLQQCSIFRENVDDLYAVNAKILSWSVPPFNSLSGSDEEKKAGARKIRDQIKGEVLTFLSQIGIGVDSDIV
jgi:arsenate reductase